MILSTFAFLFICVFLSYNFKKGLAWAIILSLFVIPRQAYIAGVIKFQLAVSLVVFAFLFFHRTIILKNKQISKFLIIPFFYILYSLLIAIFATDIPFYQQLLQLLKKSFDYFFFPFVALYVFQSYKDKKYFFNILFLCVIVLSLYGVVEYLFHSNLYLSLFESSFVEADFMNNVDFFMGEDRGGIHGRISVSTVHPLNWGQYELVVMLFAISFFSKSVKFNILLSSLIFINIFLTGSRSSLVPAVFFLGTFWLLNALKKPKIFFILLFSGISLIPVLYLMPNNTLTDTVKGQLFFWDDSASEKIGTGGSSVSLREDQLSNVFFFLDKSNVFCGYGYGYTYYQNDSVITDYLLGFESIVFVILIEQGFLGLFCYLFLYVLLYRAINSSMKRKKQLLFIMIVSYLISLFLTGERQTFNLFLLCLFVMNNFQFNNKVRNAKLVRTQSLGYNGCL